MAVGVEDKQFQQFNYVGANVWQCLLGLHTRGQQLKDSTLQNLYMALIFMSFDFKNLDGGWELSMMKAKFLSKKSSSFMSKLIQTPLFLYVNGFLPCHLKGSMSKVLSTWRPLHEVPIISWYLPKVELIVMTNSYWILFNASCYIRCWFKRTSAIP
jgi:hypothetical protein